MPIKGGSTAEPAKEKQLAVVGGQLLGRRSCLGPESSAPAGLTSFLQRICGVWIGLLIPWLRFMRSVNRPGARSVFRPLRGLSILGWIAPLQEQIELPVLPLQSAKEPHHRDPEHGHPGQ